VPAGFRAFASPYQTGFIRFATQPAKVLIEEAGVLVRTACPNADEFDPAKLAQVISKYLDPQPRIEVFNNIRAEGGERYVLIVFSPDQPRPIVTVSEGTSDTPQKRTHFRLGDIWIKKGTGLQTATRADLDSIYERHVNEEAENRGRRRFKHFREELEPSVGVSSLAISTPSRALLVGDRKDLRSFAEVAISTADIGRLRILAVGSRKVELKVGDVQGPYVQRRYEP
jgi:hypothetical protein